MKRLMNGWVPLCLLSLVCAGCGLWPEEPWAPAVADAEVLPRPAEMERLPGVCRIRLAPDGRVLNMVRRTDRAIPAEGYRLELGPGGVSAAASTEAGFFYARQTLAQLLPTNAAPLGPLVRCEAPCVKIVDAPRFAWRGLMLDSSRHFVPVDEVKRFIDTMARFKLNVFHWHLVDSHGWRMEVPRYPKLTEVAAWRDQLGYPEPGKTGRYGGFYTVAEMKDVVAYAAARHVTVVPEIEIPGHCAASITAYPSLACEGQTQFFPETFGSYPCRNQNFRPCGCNVYCAGKETTFEFLTNVLDEACAIFPSEYIHIGGDEVGTGPWQHCAACQARAKELGLKDVKELMPYFANRIARHLALRGRKAIGWDDILDGGMPQSTAIMSWRGIAGGLAAAHAGHKVVMAPEQDIYLDRGQTDYGPEPNHWPGVNKIDKVYAFEPVPAELEKAGGGELVLGAEGCLWTIYTNTRRLRDTQAWPRALAIAELCWSRKDRRGYPDFQKRAARAEAYLDALGIDYWAPTKKY